MQGIERQGHLIQEINQQQSLSDIALTLNATLNLETLLKLTVTAVGSFFNADGALIFLPDETRRKLVLRAHYNQTSAKVELPTDVVVDAFSSVPGSVLQNREPFTLKDGIEQPLKNPVQSLLYVPMISRNNVVGVLGIYDLRKKEAFSGEMLKLIQQLASHAAVAIDNAHIYANSQARSFELALVTDAAEAVNSTLSLPRVLSLVGKNLLTALQINWVEVLICNAEQEEFIMLSSQRSASWEKDNPPVVVIKTPSFRKQLFNDNWIRITIDDMSLKEADLLDGAVEVVIFPLRDGDKLTGIIRLAFVEKDTCNPDEILQEVQRRGEKIAEAALSDNDNRALSYAYQISRVVETVGGCSFWVWEPEKERLKLRIDESSLVWNEPAYPLRDGSMFPTLLNIVNRQSIANYGTTSRNFPLDIERLAHEHRL
ncbi:MAG TPA: GAF domain-containing protein, partial [Aggregatilineales bacterium]|nr:GAF domain-containing protein [Aggregatilineales bacterium]